MRNKPTPLPYSVYFVQIGAYALFGLLISLYLAYTHYKNFTDITFSSFCAISQAINCDTVAQSPWSIFWGMPIAIWGVFYYTLFLLFCTPLKNRGEHHIPGWSLVMLVALSASFGSVALAAVSYFRIHSWCILCVGIYAINLLLGFSAWIIYRRFCSIGFWRAVPLGCKQLIRSIPVKLGVPLLIVLLIALRVALPPYWNLKPERIESKVSSGLTDEGFPWIGADKPRITIEEFTDYQCFQCRKVHFYLRDLINRYPDKIRLIHRQYPLDNEFNRILVPNPFHVGSGRLALIAIVAADHNVFWAVNDAIYSAVQSKKATIAIDEFAALMGISPEQLAREMVAKKTLKHLQHDIVQGLQHGITGTPTFVVEGKVYPKILPPKLLEKVIQ